jgi:hypothetical protein
MLVDFALLRNQLQAGLDELILPHQTKEWPYSGDKPMLPLAQVNVEELHVVPNSLEDIAFITIFIDCEALPIDHNPNGSGWLIRTYKNINSLKPIEPPDQISPIKPFPMKPRVYEKDYPCWEDVAGSVPEELDENYYDLFDNLGGFKIGGWPTLIQAEIFWAPWNKHPANPEYVFQIDTEEKAHWSWGDGGVGYFGRGTAKDHEDTWVLEWQCY